MPGISRWIGSVALGFAGLVAGCGASAPRVNSCGSPAYTFTFPSGRQVLAGDCPGYLSGPPHLVTVRRGETFTLKTGNAAIPVGPPVPRPNGRAVVVISVHRTPHQGTTATYRAAKAGRTVLVVRHETFCLPPAPQQGEPLRRYRRAEQAQKLALEHPKPRNCPALAVRVIG